MVLDESHTNQIKNSENPPCDFFFLKSNDAMNYFSDIFQREAFFH